MSAVPANAAAWSRVATRERLVTALIFALLVHGVILLGVGFVSLVPKQAHGPAVAVTLVRDTRVVPPPRRMDYLAQRNQRGPGNTRGKDSPEGAANPADPFPNPGIPLAAALAAQAPAQANPALATALRKRAATGPGEVAATTAKTAPVRSGEVPLTGSERPLLMARLATAAEQPRAARAPAVSLPRIHGETPQRSADKTNARASVYAPYLEAWRTRVEAIGSAQFARLVPSRIKRGHLTLAVSLNADGSIRSVDIVQRSHYPELDAAALKIIRLAAPFQPFPPAVRRRTEVLSFAYRWNFIRGGGVGGSVGLGGS